MTHSSCIFCQIAAGEAPCHEIWSSSTHMAFLSIFPNTEGFSVVIPREHHPSYAFAAEDEVLSELILATKQAARALDTYFDDVGRTGMFFEGFGVDHLHSKLFPMHGTGNMNEWKPIESGPSAKTYFAQYPGYLSSHDGARADDGELAKLARAIRQANDSSNQN